MEMPLTRQVETPRLAPEGGEGPGGLCAEIGRLDGLMAEASGKRLAELMLLRRVQALRLETFFIMEGIRAWQDGRASAH